jgi:hypothetical protein
VLYLLTKEWFSGCGQQLYECVVPKRAIRRRWLGSSSHRIQLLMLSLPVCFAAFAF